MILLAVHMFYRKGKFTNFTKGSVVSTTELLECYIQQIKCLKRAFDKITTIQAICLVLQSSKLLLNQLVTFCCSVGKLALLFYKLCFVSMGNVMSIQ